MTEPPDNCTECDGQGGHPIVLDEAEGFRISRGWTDCKKCGGSGKGKAQRRIAAAKEREPAEVADE